MKKSKADEEATWRSEMTREDMNDPLKNTPLQPEREARPAHPRSNPRHGQPKQEQEESNEVANPVVHAPPSKSFFSGRGGNHSHRGGRNQPSTNSNIGAQQQVPRDGQPPRPKTRGARGGGVHNGPKPAQTNGTDGTAPTDAKTDKSPKGELRSGLGRGPRRGRNDGRGTGRPTPGPTAGSEGPTNPAEHPEFDFDASMAAFDKEKLFAEIEHERLIAAKPPTAELDFFDNISRDDKDPGDRSVQQQRRKDQQTFGPRVGREGGVRRPPSNNPGANKDASAPRPPSTGDRGRRGGRGRGGGRGKPNYREKGASPSEANSVLVVPVAESS